MEQNAEICMRSIVYYINEVGLQFIEIFGDLVYA